MFVILDGKMSQANSLFWNKMISASVESGTSEILSC